MSAHGHKCEVRRTVSGWMSAVGGVRRTRDGQKGQNGREMTRRTILNDQRARAAEKGGKAGHSPCRVSRFKTDCAQKISVGTWPAKQIAGNARLPLALGLVIFCVGELAGIEEQGPPASNSSGLYQWETDQPCPVGKGFTRSAGAEGKKETYRVNSPPRG